MKSLLPHIKLISFIGFVFGLSAHVVGFWGIVVSWKIWLWFLLIGVIFVLPVVYYFVQNQLELDRGEITDNCFTNIPKSYKILSLILFLYTITYYIIWGGYQDTTIGKFISAYNTFTPIMMTFYFISYAILLSRLRTKTTFLYRRCINGHLFPQTFNYCPICGNKTELIDMSKLSLIKYFSIESKIESIYINDKDDIPFLSKKCKNGHVVSKNAKFCQFCGEIISKHIEQPDVSNKLSASAILLIILSVLVVISIVRHYL